MNWDPSNYEVQHLADQIFARFDKDKSGNLSENQLRDMLAHFGLKDDYHYNDFVTFYDRQSNGEIDKKDLHLFCRVGLMTERLLKIYDTNKSNTLEGSEVTNMLKGIGMYSQKQYQDLLRYFDKDQNGLITKNQLHHFCKIKAFADLNFKKYDKDQSGRISLKEAVPLLRKYKYFSQQDVQNLKTWDVDHDGELNRNEFYRLMRKLSQKALLFIHKYLQQFVSVSLIQKIFQQNLLQNQ